MNKGAEPALSEREIKEAIQQDDEFFIQILVQDDISLNIPFQFDGKKQYLLEYAFYAKRPKIFGSLLRHGARFGLIEDNVLQYIRTNRASRKYLNEWHRNLLESHTQNVLERRKQLVAMESSFDELATQLLPVSTPRRPPRIERPKLHTFLKFEDQDPEVASVVYDLCTGFIGDAPIPIFDLATFRQTVIGLLPRSKPVTLVRMLHGFFEHFDDSHRVRALIFLKELIVRDDYHLCFKDSEFQHVLSEYTEIAIADGRADLIEMLKKLIEMRQALRIPLGQSIAKIDDVLNVTAPDLIDVEKLLAGSVHQSSHGREFSAQQLATDLASIVQRFYARLRPGLLMWPNEEGESGESFQCFGSTANFKLCLQKISDLLSEPITRFEKAKDRMRVMKFYIEALRHLVKGQAPNQGGALFLDGVLETLLPHLPKGKLDEKWAKKRKDLQKILMDEHVDWMPSLDRYVENLQIVRTTYTQKQFHHLCFMEGKILLDYMTRRCAITAIPSFRTNLFQLCSQPIPYTRKLSLPRDTLTFIPELRYEDLMSAMKAALEKKVPFQIIHKGETLRDRRKILQPLCTWLEESYDLSAQQKLDALLTLDKMNDKTSLDHSGKYGRQFKFVCAKYRELVEKEKEQREKEEKEEKESSSEETKSLADSKRPLIATPERGISSEDPIFALDSEGELKASSRGVKKLLKQTRRKKPERSHSTTSTLMLEEPNVEALVEETKILAFSGIPTQSPEVTPPPMRHVEHTPPIQRRDPTSSAHLRSQSSDSSDGKVGSTHKRPRLITRPSH